MINFKRNLYRPFGQAITEYGLIKDRDRLLVALSGGKDSMTLIELLLRFLSRAPINVELHAIHIDLWDNAVTRENVKLFCRERDVPLELISKPASFIKQQIEKRGQSPCYVCARERRLLIFKYAEEKFSSVVYGHHLGDFAETLIMNLFYSGSMQVLPVVQPFFNGRISVIRPMVYIEPEVIRVYSQYREMVPASGDCPYNDCSERSRVRLFIEQMTKSNKYCYSSLRSALSKELTLTGQSDS